MTNKQTSWVKNLWNFKNAIYCFCCYVNKSAGETAKKLLLCNLKSTVIEINLSQIRTLDIKREKVCTVFPTFYLTFASSKNICFCKYDQQ